MFTTDEYSQLIKRGNPNVYLLNATKNSVNADLRWFEIGRPKKNSKRDHKIIILMGAIGSGKSTLIDGMVNYILGVNWTDPYRFKCVREDESAAGAARHHAHNQTSSVTAYTIHHQDGMAISYSITIIDTPGYGDITRGVKRDKEITQLIHRFLTKPDTYADHIHAVCFVASSGSCRLTVTQSYIIDSVLSSFAKDFKDNFRLLVTFADDSDPPVVEACRESHFPMTSPLVGITYNKFNNSALYATTQGGEDGNELFWVMGQENYENFFKMLEGMDCKDLKSTRQVVQRRQKLEQSLKNIKRELELYFVEIENVGLFVEHVKHYGYDKESVKQITIEKTVMRPTKLNCKKGFVAYNCHRCSTTCEEPIESTRNHEVSASQRQCNKPDEICKCQGDDHSYEEFVWRNVPVKVKMTLENMKTEFELNYKGTFTTEELLVKCSEELSQTKAKVLSLLEQVGVTTRSLESAALRSNALSPADYISMMRSRVAEEQAPGYLVRLDTLTELQNNLLANEESACSAPLPEFYKKNSTRRGRNDSNSSLQTNSSSAGGVSSPLLHQPVSIKKAHFEGNHGEKSANDLENFGSTVTVSEKCNPFKKLNCISNNCGRKRDEGNNSICLFCF